GGPGLGRVSLWGPGGRNRGKAAVALVVGAGAVPGRARRRPRHRRPDDRLGHLEHLPRAEPEGGAQADRPLDEVTPSVIGDVDVFATHIHLLTRTCWRPPGSCPPRSPGRWRGWNLR